MSEVQITDNRAEVAGSVRPSSDPTRRLEPPARAAAPRAWPGELRRWAPILVAAALLTAATAATARAADPFYEALLRKGAASYYAGDHGTAVEQLRTACFGLLSEPVNLATCQTYLGLAHAAGGDEAAFREVFQKLSELELQFGAWSSAPIPQDERSELEAAVRRLIPEPALRSSSAFAHLVASQEERLAGLPLRGRLDALERLVKDAPQEPRWRLLLAEAQLEQGDRALARRTLERAVAEVDDDAPLRRRLGLLLTADREWDGAAEQLLACGLAAEDGEVALALLSALAAAGRHQEVLDVAAGLAPELRARSDIARLVELARVALAEGDAETAPDAAANEPAAGGGRAGRSDAPGGSAPAPALATAR